MSSKRNLVILLLIPFVISLLTFTAISMTFNLIDNDIVDIAWDYKDHEAFALSGDKTRHKLVARAINDKNYPTAQTLKWSVDNANKDEDAHAEIVVENNNSYLHTLSLGEIVISVTNDKGNVQKKMNATIFDKNYIVINPSFKTSQSNVDSNIYFGQFDLGGSGKVLSGFDYEIDYQCEYSDSGVRISSSSSNIKINQQNKHVEFLYGVSKEVEDAYFTVSFDNPKYVETATYKFKIVKDGVNVYSYNDLMACTNKSTNGEIVVLRKNLESLATYSLMKDSGNTEVFGNPKNDKFNFKDDVYKFHSKFNTKYLNGVDGNGGWNKFARDSRGQYQEVSDYIYVGVRVQKSFYGNGFTLNLHNLTYPYSQTTVVDSETGETQIVPMLTDDNIFRGPLPYYTLGDPNKMPLVTTYGQDNIGLYVDGNNITINDLIIKNCDFGNNMVNLDTVGTTVEVADCKNITIKNSRLSNGKNVLKTYDSENVLVDNCMLSYSRNFLLMTGSYLYKELNYDNMFNFICEDGASRLMSLSEYLSYKGLGDMALENYLYGNYNSKEMMIAAMKSLQSGLDAFRPSTYMGDTIVRDCLFYRSGISSIAFESLFNGPFLYNASPSVIGDLFGTYGSVLDQYGAAIPYFPSGIGGVSYPVELTLEGSTKFYDYKTTNLFDINGLVGQTINELAKTAGYDIDITLDAIFPIKTILLEEASSRKAIYKNEINVPVVFYGGGYNYSRLNFGDSFVSKDALTDVFDVDFLSRYTDIGSQGTGTMANIVGVMLKSVTVVSGFNPFKFSFSNDTSLYGLAPQVQTLIDNQK